MNTIRFWFAKFQFWFMVIWGLIYVGTLLVRFLDFDVDEYYSHPPMERVVGIAFALGIVSATLNTVYSFYIGELHNKQG